MGNRVYIETWGCQMNLRQSEGLAGVMRDAGYEIVGRLEAADVALFNGCMVRQKAEEKVYGRIGAVVEEKRKRTVTLGVGGCLGQIHQGELLSRFSAIDFVFGSGGHASLPSLVRDVIEGAERIVQCEGLDEIDEIPSVRRSAVSAMVTITEGCSNHCSYCIVPFARGPMRSRAADRILAEVEEAIDGGAVEVLLLGQNVNAYGTDRAEGDSFAMLLARVASTGIGRVRFTTSHPRDMSDDVLDVMGSTANVCPHLHLPVQSGSDRILGEMRRGYSVARYLEIIEAARARVEGLNVTTDLIVGYPGETAEDFEETMRLIEDVRFGSIFAAKYSPRPLTRSARFDDDIPEAVKGERLERILSRQRRIALEENERFIGRELDVLFESDARGGGAVGRAMDHRTVVSVEAEAGAVRCVRVGAASAAGLSGSVRICQGVEGVR